MYGYVKAHAPELKVREQEYYRGVYCGLCRTMGKCTGQCSRLTLSYDFTFLALLRLALTGQDVTLAPHRCALHPMKKKAMAEPNDALTYCAYTSAILAYHKIRDDRNDEKGARRLKANLAAPYVKSLRRRALKAGYSDLDRRVSDAMKTLSDLEAAHLPSVDRPAELFGGVMAELVSHGLEGTAARVGRTLGHHVGRWIYLIDAIDDYEEDKEKGRYNPFDCLWQGGEMTDTRRIDLTNALRVELVAVESALDLVDPGQTDGQNLWGTLRNILYLGMPAAAHRVLYPDEQCQGKRKHLNQEHKTKGDQT